MERFDCFFTHQSAKGRVKCVVCRSECFIGNRFLLFEIDNILPCRETYWLVKKLFGGLLSSHQLKERFTRKKNNVWFENFVTERFPNYLNTKVPLGGKHPLPQGGDSFTCLLEIIKLYCPPVCRHISLARTFNVLCNLRPFHPLFPSQTRES